MVYPDNTLTLNPLNPSYMHHCHVGNPTFLNVKSNGCDDFKKAQTSGAYDHEAGSSCTKCSRNVETIEEALLPNLLHTIGYGEEIDRMLKISLREAQSNEEIFFSMAWVRAFNIREPIYPELCRELYATYEFNEVCADDELQSKKIISFRLGGRAHSLTLTTGYEKIQKNDLWLLSMFEDRHQNGYASVAWVIAKWMKRKEAGSQKESQICCGQFISKSTRKNRVLTDEIERTLTTSIYCRDLDRLP
ncbi:hypothetical protein Tco_0053749 [Tanacetum coccineum]